MEGIVNSEGEEGWGGRGVKDQGNCRGKGGCMINLVSRGPLIDLSDNLAVQKSFVT